MSRIADGIAAVILTILVGTSVRGLGGLPPVGPLLDPIHGVWATAAGAQPLGKRSVLLGGLGAPVQVRVDRRGVPHVFAQSYHDAVYVMGYVVARDRLFQMEAQTRAAAGRLAEWAGRPALAADRQSRAIGLGWAAERKWSELDTTSSTYQTLVAYSQGVNAWIDQLTPATLPLEYRLLQATPIRWEPKYTLYFYSEMGRTLALNNLDVVRGRVGALVGKDAAEGLFPLHAPLQQPIVPNGHPTSTRLPVSLPPPGVPDASVGHSFADQLGVLAGREPPGNADRIGSNNWAVAPERTKGGYALLAGDPHLELTLPSIWYEIHLNVQDSLDVAGVSFPGSPGVIIGFNREIAWSFTNTGGDVIDYYRETVDDEGAPTRYLLDGEWRDLTLTPTVFRGRGGGILLQDTLRYTHRGPLLPVGEEWYSMRWTVHDPSHDTDVFAQMQGAHSVDEWLTVMEHFVAPTQNGIVADRQGTIAIRSSGSWPVRPGDGRGDRIFDGSRSANDWVGRLPVERYPGVRAPAQGYLASANQEPVDPRRDSTYLGANWPSPWRAIRINTLLRSDSAVTPDAMRRFQTDPGSARVHAFLPFFLRDSITQVASAEDSLFRRGLSILQEWDGTYRGQGIAPLLFETALGELTNRLWDELIDPGGSSGRRVATPSEAVLLALLDLPASPWWDDSRTPGVQEDRDELLIESLSAAYLRLLTSRGAPRDGRWRWSEVRFANIMHLLRLPALSRRGIAVEGGPSTLSPSSGRGQFGASWRMVVELGPVVRAWGTYPGGQSGNPASRWYDDRITQWQQGQLDTLLFPRAADDLSPTEVVSTLIFEGASR